MPAKKYSTPEEAAEARRRGSRESYARHATARRASSREYHAVNGERRRAHAKQAMADQRASDGGLANRTARQKWCHGWTMVERDAFISAHGGICGICGTSEPGDKGWAVDHDHSCCPASKSCVKCRRGILCSRHNLMLGLAQDNPETLEAGAAYLRRHRVG